LFQVEEVQQSLIRRFQSNISAITLPEKFTFPFYYEAHPLVEIAAKQLQEELSNRAFNHNFGLHTHQQGLIIGKMFGVLVIQDEQGELGFLAAFSGKLGDANHHEGFVPPVFDMLSADSYFKEEEVLIHELTLQIEALEKDTAFQSLLHELKTTEVQAFQDLERLKTEIKSNKARRKQARTEATTALNFDELSQFLNNLSKESVKEQFTLKDANRYWTYVIEAIKAKIEECNKPIEALKLERKTRSNQLQQKLFSDYAFLNAKLETKSLLDIFKDFNNIPPPAGAGECAAPKLLHYAYQHRLKPIALGEFWWGASPKSEVRVHQQFYPSCRSKCEPILGHMLQGLKVDENPFTQNHAHGKSFEIVYEDEDLMVINKPAEFLSVPGKSVYDSVQSRIAAMYPNATGPLLVHRLDMSTSGLLLIAKDKDIHQKLQAQFLQRTIQKRYEALVDGDVEAEKGEIKLPLRLDLDNRPQQLVCYEYGKKALTRWEKVKVRNGKTLLNLYPITGRTHQLRVHCAHPLGLGVPICGDDLYGNKSDRLYLHAAYLKFMHPKQQKELELYVASGF
jgi:tRNA pseudouridine32 synthase / 23S rRNA pseudouridine746 synthase